MCGFGKSWRQAGCGKALGRRMPAQRGVGHHKHVFVASHFELQVGREIRKQPAVRVVGVHDDRVGDDVLIHAGVEPRLIWRDDALKRLVGIGIDREPHRLPGMNVADIGLVDRGPDLHPLQILGDQEQARRIEARDDRLADVDAAIDDHAFDRRLDRAVAEIRLGPFKIRLGVAQVGVRLGDSGLRVRQTGIGLGDGAAPTPTVASAASYVDRARS